MNKIATFVMPIYLRKKEEIEFFKKSVKGILNQSDQDFQVVIIDDNTDESLYKLILEYIEGLNDERFKLIRMNKNRGPGYCRNIGIDYANKTSSPFILYNDADDVSNPKRLEYTRKIFKDEEVGVVYSTFIPIDENDKEIPYKNLVESLKNILDGNKNNPIHGKDILIKLATEKNYTNLTSSTSVRTSLAYKFKFPTFRVSEDCYTWYMYASSGKSFYYCKEIPTKYRLRNNGSSNSRENLDDFYRRKIKADSLGFKKALNNYSKNNLVLKNEKVKAFYDFYNCLYKVVEKESSKELLTSLEKKINKYNYYLDINIKEGKNYIVQVIVPQTEGKVGGSDTHVLSLSTCLKDDKNYTPIILFTRNTEYLEKIKNNDISYIFCGKCKSKLKQLYLLSDLPKKYNIKVMHSHQYNANYLASAIKLYDRLWRKIPCVMTCHGWIENNIVDRYYTFWDFFTYLFASALICVSRKDEKRLNDGIYKNKKKYYIPNGVFINNNKNNKKEILKKYSIPNNKKVIAYVGRLAPEKRIDLIIESARICCEKNNDIIYIICGSGDEENNIKSLIKTYSLENKVFMLGYIANINEIHSITDLLVLSSDTEGTPRAVLEAMSNKVCVVSTNVGGLKEIIDNNVNGVLVEKGNYNELSDKILYLIDNDEIRNKYAINGYKKINENFDIKKMEKEIKEVYNKL